MNALKNNIQDQISDVFSFSKGLFDVSTSVDLRIVYSVDEINDNDHVFKIVNQQDLGNSHLAESDNSGLQIRLGTNLAEKILSGDNTRTISHELGHTGGLGHVSDKNNLMSQSLNRDQNFGKDITVSQFYSIKRNYDKGILNRNTTISRYPSIMLLRSSKYVEPLLQIKWLKKLRK